MLLKVRLGQLDRPLAAIIPQLLALPPEDYTRLILSRSRNELIDQFTNQDLPQ
jgi:hypothetical protein